MPDFLKLEETESREDIQRSLSFLDAERERLAAFAQDNASWSDMYRFVAQPDDAFIPNTFTSQTIDSFKLEWLTIMDAKGNALVQQVFGVDARLSANLRAELSKLLTPRGPVFSGPDSSPATFSGIVSVNGAPYLMAAMPITDGLRAQEANGTLVVGRHINAALIQNMSAVQKAHYQLLAPDDSRLPSGFEASRAGAVSVIRRDDRIIDTYAAVPDQTGSTAFVIHSAMERDIYQNGLYSSQLFLLVLIGVGLVAGVFTIAFRNQALKSRNRERELNALYREMVTRSYSGIILVNTKDCRITEANEAFCLMAGESPDTVAELSLSEAFQVPPESLYAFLVSAQAGSRESSFHPRNGSNLMVEFQSNLISRDQHDILALTINDISTRKRFQNELETRVRERTRELLVYKAAFEHSPVSVIITDLQGRIEYCNPFTETLTGYRLGELKGQPAREFMTEVNTSGVYQEIAQAVTHGATWHGVFQSRKKSGETYWEQGYFAPILNEHGELDRVLVIKDDISATKLLEDALAQEKHLLETIVRTSPVGLGLLRNRRFEWVNPALEKETGWNMAEVQGRDARLLYPDDDEYQRIGAFLYHPDNRHRPIEGRMLSHNGNIRDVQIQATPVNPDRPDQSWLVAVTDIGDVKNLQRKYEQLLLNILPESVARELLTKRKVVPRRYEDVTVMFTDFTDFTRLTGQLDPEMLIRELNDVFSAFDMIMESNLCQRIKTIGDGYLAVCGLPESDPQSALRMVTAAFQCIAYLDIRNSQLSGKELDINWEIRVGIHTGPVVAGIVGSQRHLFDVFGDTVNLASRIEQQSAPHTVTVSEHTQARIADHFASRDLGARDIKGKGAVRLFAVEKAIATDAEDAAEPLAALPEEP